MFELCKRDEDAKQTCMAGPASRQTHSIFHARLTLLCDPSQNGGVPVRLQAQKATRRFSVAVHFSGVNGVPAWEPSQSGCLADRPQAHHQ
jgi:hypothetical protein